MIALDTQALDLIAQGALVVVNHSGGKDSQCQLIKLLEVTPRSQLIVIHADLGEIEWPGATDLARTQAEDAGVPFLVAHAFFHDGRPKSFLDKVAHQWGRRQDAPPFPSPKNRWCTGELKTQPIEREVRRYAKAHGFSIVLNALGERADESDERKARPRFERVAANCCQGREWFDWRPIHHLTKAEVFATIAQAGQEPHWAYAQGNDRLSCLFCIYGCAGDLANGARQNPELFARYTAWEERTGFSLHVDRKPLAALVAQATL